MWDFTPTVLGAVALRTFLVYLFLLLGLRLTGKREVGQLAPFDLVLLLVISNAVQNAMVGPDTSLTGGLMAAAVLLALNRCLAWMDWRWPGIRRLLEGQPTLLVQQGQVMHRNLDRERISFEELQAALREHEVTQISEVDLATLEVDGTISVIRKTAQGGYARTNRPAGGLKRAPRRRWQKPAG